MFREFCARLRRRRDGVRLVVLRGQLREQDASGFQHSVRLSEPIARVSQVLEHVARGERVDAARRQRARREEAAHEPRPHASRRRVHRCEGAPKPLVVMRIGLEAREAATVGGEVAEIVQHVAARAADLDEVQAAAAAAAVAEGAPDVGRLTQRARVVRTREVGLTAVVA